mmetsp:Transcript_21254/g.54122  ORF Transcript_21254/g.54122 Transcript_21254/m.54122 type:complete len:357 (+) Transcript_21254:252-1322(+)
MAPLLERLGLLLGGLGPEVGVEHGGEVALAEGGDDAHDGLALVLGAGGELLGRPDRRARRDAAHDALGLRERLRGGDGVVVGHLQHLVDHAQVGVARHEARADALDLVRALVLAAREHGAAHGLERHELALGLERLDVLRAAGQRAARADAGDEDVDLALGVRPDLRPGRLAVDLRVVGVVELLEQLALVAQAGDDLLGLHDRATHALGGGGEHQLGAERLEHDAALHGHGLGHGEDHVVATRRGHHRERDAGVARGGLDQRRHAGRDLAARLRLHDHRVADAILDGVARLHGLHLEQDGRVKPLGVAAQLEQRRVADELGDVVGDLGPRALAHHGAELGDHLLGWAHSVVSTGVG